MRRERKMELDVIADEELYFGRRVYVVTTKDFQKIPETCPICDGTKKVTIRGREFDCPNCTKMYYGQDGQDCLTLYNYCIMEYIINVITIRGEETKGAYCADGKMADGKRPYAEFFGFTRTGPSYDSIHKRGFSSYSFEFKGANHYDVRSKVKDVCFLDRKNAVCFAKQLHRSQKELLDVFNAEHGTNHEYPFSF